MNLFSPFNPVGMMIGLSGVRGLNPIADSVTNQFDMVKKQNERNARRLRECEERSIRQYREHLDDKGKY